jgi:hypothetical protein
MTKNPTLFLALVVAFLAQTSFAFVASVPNTKKAPSLLLTQLRQSAEPFEDKRKAVSWVDLPRPLQDDRIAAALPSAEQWVGRLAMVGAVGLIVGEITTGHSFSEQFIDLLSQQ